MRWAVYAVAIYAACLVALALWGAPLGHDEAQYALGGAALLGRDVSAYPLHRPVGMQLVAAPAALVGSDLAFHALALALVFAMLGAVYAYARRAHGARAAGWTTLVVASSFAVMHAGTELLPDPAATALVLAFAAVLVSGLGPAADPAHRWRLIALGPLAAAAFYLRYGSITVIASLAVSAAIVWRRRLAANAAPLAAAALIAIVLVIPHVVQSLHVTGSPLGIVEWSSFAAGRAYRGDGLVFYATQWWLWLGPAAAVCVLAGGAAAIARHSEVASFAGLASLVAIVVLGLDAHGEARFVLVPEVLLVGAGVEVLLARAYPRPRLARAALAAAFAVGLTTTAVALSHDRQTFATAVRAAGALRKAAGGAPCTVYSGQWTQLEWYSGCWGVMNQVPMPPVDPGRTTFLVWYERGRRQPPEILSGVHADEVARVPGTGLWGGATVYQLR